MRRGALWRAGEPAERRRGRLVGGEEALDPELVKRDVVGRSEAGEDREEAEASVALAKLDGEERRRRRVEVERPPLAGDVGIGQELVEEAAGLDVARAQQIAVEALDEGRRGSLRVADEGPEPGGGRRETH